MPQRKNSEGESIMSGAPEPKIVPAPKPKIMKVNITYDILSKEFQFNGPMDQPALCLGLLEMAKIVVATKITGQVKTSGLVVPH
jgi:hypothetical protein